MASFGKLFILLGLGIAALGALLLLGERFRWFRFGRLPGDISYEKNGVGIYIPITSMILLSALLTLLFWIMGRGRR